MNQKEEALRKALRRNQVRLFVCGRGIVAFTVWIFIRVFLAEAVSPKIRTMLHNTPGMTVKGEIFVLLFTGIALALTLGIRMSTGFRASAEAEGRKRSRFLFFGGLLLLADSFISIAVSLPLFTENTEDDLFTTLLIEGASAFITLEMLYSLVRVRQLRKKLAGGR